MGNETGSSQQSVKSLFVPTAKQQEALDLLNEGRRHTLLVGGSRSGKTTLLVHEIAAARAADRQFASRHPAPARQRGARLDRARYAAEGVSPVAFPGGRSSGIGPRAISALDNGSEIWIGGLDDQEQVEKILGKEYATIFLNECSQIPYASVLVALTRLAQVVGGLTQAAYYDLNPTNKGHWTNVLFGDKRDPISRQPLADPDDYARMFLNPGDNAGKSFGGVSEKPGKPAGTAAQAVFRRRLYRRARRRAVQLRDHRAGAGGRVCAGALASASWWRSIRRARRAATTSAPTRSASSLPRRATTATPMCSPTARCATRRRLGAAPRCRLSRVQGRPHRRRGEFRRRDGALRHQRRRRQCAGAGHLCLARQGAARRAGVGALRAGAGASRRPLRRAGRSALRLHHAGLSRRGQPRSRRRAGVRRHRIDAQGPARRFSNSIAGQGTTDRASGAGTDCCRAVHEPSVRLRAPAGISGVHMANLALTTASVPTASSS